MKRGIKRKATTAGVALAIVAGGLGAFAPATSATTTCTYTIGWYKQDESRIAGPDLTGDLVDGIFTKTGLTPYEVLWAPAGGNADLIAAKQLIAAAANGGPGSSGFAGTSVGDAFHALASYFEGGPSLTRSELIAFAGALDDYNNGLREIPHC